MWKCENCGELEVADYLLACHKCGHGLDASPPATNRTTNVEKTDERRAKMVRQKRVGIVLIAVGGFCALCLLQIGGNVKWHLQELGPFEKEFEREFGFKPEYKVVERDFEINPLRSEIALIIPGGFEGASERLDKMKSNPKFQSLNDKGKLIYSENKSIWRKKSSPEYGALSFCSYLTAFSAPEKIDNVWTFWPGAAEIFLFILLGSLMYFRASKG